MVGHFLIHTSTKTILGMEHIKSYLCLDKEG